MSESGFTPPDGGDRRPRVGEPPPQQYPPPPGWAPPPAPRWTIGRPRAVTAASVVWIILGAILAVAGIGAMVNPVTEVPADSTGPAVGFTLGATGVLLIIFAVRMRRGRREARTVLTVIGAIAMFGLWPIVFVVPALILQYRADNNAWFDANRPPPPWPTP